MSQIHRPNLESIRPEQAAEMYHASKADQIAEHTLKNQKKHVSRFVEWLDDEGIDNMNDVSSRDVHRFRLTLNGYADATKAAYAGGVKRFIRYCEAIDAVYPATAERIEVEYPDTSRDTILESDRAERILDYLAQYHYSSHSHALLSLLWETGMRRGTVRALDVGDFDRERERLRVRHRPETETPLKNGENAERYVTISPELTETLRDYLDGHRHDVTDDHGRHPLMTTGHGRPSPNWVSRTMYGITRPCKRNEPCPHGRNPDNCEGAGRVNEATYCPSSISAHPVRRGAITHWLREDVPERVVSARMDVSEKILERHYDRRTASEKAEQRRRFLGNV